MQTINDKSMPFPFVAMGGHDGRSNENEKFGFSPTRWTRLNINYYYCAIFQRLAQTTERIVNFKARLITSLI